MVTKSPLKIELKNLERKYRQEQNRLGEIENSFFRDGGTCCPSCGVLGYSKSVEAQKRRLDRIAYLRKKIHLSRKAFSKEEARLTILCWIDLDNSLQPLHVDRVWRLNFLANRFLIDQNHLLNFITSNGGLKRWHRDDIVEWCNNNEDMVFTATDNILFIA